MRNGQVTSVERFRRSIAITLSDVTTYVDSIGSPGTQVSVQVSTEIPDAFLVGVGGDVTIVDMSGNTTLLKNLIAGMVYAIAATKFKATGTTATNLVALYY